MTDMTVQQFHAELNFRDLGGYPGADDRKIQTGIFYRSGSLSFMTPEELEAFKHLGIRCVIDLRSERENTKHPDPELPGIMTFRCSGVVSKGGEGIDFSPRGMNQIGEAGEEQLQALRRYYQDMPFQNEAFRTMMKQIAENNVPMCVHCATGKDRTGAAAMIILLLLGVKEETVLTDYMLSCQYRKAIIDRTMQENEERIKASPVLKELLTMEEGVSEQIGRLLLKNMKERYGSYDAYFLHEYGLSKEMIQEIRHRYLQ